MSNHIIIKEVSISELQSFIASAIEKKLQVLTKNEPVNSGYLTRQETAKLLRISYPTLSELTRNGTLKGYRIGSRILYRQSEVENSLSEIQTQKYRRA